MHRVAIYGIEGHEGLILSSVAQRDDAVVAAVASENPARFDEAKGYDAITGETKFYGSWQEILDNEDIDVLGICSETDRHVDVIVAAAERGIHVMSEKPIAPESAGLEKIKAAVATSGIHFSALLSMRTAPGYAAMRDAVRSGAIGKPVLLFGQKSYRLGERPEWMKSRSSFGGIIPYIGCHMLDLAMWITGLDVIAVSAAHGNTSKPEVREMEDHAAVIFKMTDGADFALTLDYLRPAAAPTHGDDRLRIAGSDGVVEVRSADAVAQVITAAEGLRDLDLPEKVNLFSDFLDAIDGKTTHIIQPEEIFRLTEILLGALEAADTGKPREV